MLFTLFTGCSAGEKAPLTGEAYTVKDSDSGIVYTNNIDGYSLTLPKETQIDMSMDSVRTALTFDGGRLYVYAEPTESKRAQTSYINYSNTFLNEHRCITLDSSGEMKLSGCKTSYNIWHRARLKHVENDYTNYVCFDIRYKSSFVYTLYFKYNDDVSYEDVILPIAESFKKAPVTSNAKDIRLGSGTSPQLSDSTKLIFDNIFGADASLTWGLFDYRMQNQNEQMKALESELDYDFDIYLLYTDFSPTVGGERLYDVLERCYPGNKIPELTLQTTPQDEGLMIFDVLDGKYDDFLESYARDVAEFNKPVLMRLGNEMNGDWCSYCAFNFGRDTDIYVEFYRYIFSVFRTQGADNAIWVWNPNHRSFPNFKWNDELMYYPGDEYVNVIGLTAYNTGTYYEGEKWSTFDELYSDLYQRTLSRYAQSMMITEFSCSGTGGDKAAWIEDMFAKLPDYPEIKAAVWWNSFDLDYSKPDTPVARQYILEQTPQTLQAFKNGLKMYKK